ncbi:hypothetical protein RN607_01095 [Demequina capsici]|uniref:Uncharacterized protein n=1 Tax=Demequina capsici TaxID=3075620 RepID=A0AA96JD35_9MICO|nr:MULTISPECIES: hypothetical protein [unclassified Demequina]WNM24722.1 hypothetical protein RN606_00810 [Demequina sp. OYTSA14]WNM27631.1 hypothetical protein RN607_01095 [Demequina sp. PMTSA13]
MFLAETRPTGRIPLAIRIIGKRGVAGAVVIGLIAVAYLVGLPMLDAALRGPGADAGRISTTGGISVLPPDGWAYEPSSEAFQVFTQAGATLIVSPAVPASGTLEDAVDPTRQQLEADAQSQWVVSDPQTFSTTAGDPAILLAAQNGTDSQLLWVVRHGDLQITVVMTAPNVSLETVFTSAQALVESVRFRPVS